MHYRLKNSYNIELDNCRTKTKKSRGETSAYIVVKHFAFARNICYATGCDKKRCRLDQGLDLAQIVVLSLREYDQSIQSVTTSSFVEFF